MFSSSSHSADTRRPSGRPGQALIEAIVAMGVLVTFAAAFVRLIMGAYEGGQEAREQTIASYRAWEGLEAVRSIAARDFSMLTDGTYGIDATGGVYVLTGSTTVGADFTPTVEIRTVRRGANGDIASVGGEDDPSTKLVTTTVQWSKETGHASTVRFSTHITDWRHPRWFVDRVVDFSGSLLHATAITESGNGSAEILPGNLAYPELAAELPFAEEIFVRDLFIDPIADRLYLLTAYRAEAPEFLVYDLANVSNGIPTLLGEVDLEAGGKAFGFDGAYAYVLQEDKELHVSVVRLRDLAIVATWEILDAAPMADITVDTERHLAYVVTSNEKVYVPSVSGLSAHARPLERFLGFLRTIMRSIAGTAFAQAAPTCLGQTATVYVNSSNVIVGGPDNGQAYAGTLRGNNGPNDIMVGTSGADSIDGRGGADVICGGDGNDTLDGGNGNDTIEGEGGVDTVTGGANDDTIDGGEGNDDLDGGNGDDTIDGGNGNDAITGGGNPDTIDGGAGDDTIDGEGGADIIHAGTGNDTVDGGSEADTVCGGAGTEDIQGGGGNDQLDGGSGTDTIDGESGTDTCRNGETLTSCENTTTDIAVCAGSGEEEEVEEEEDVEERDTDIPEEKFYVLNIAAPESPAPIVSQALTMETPVTVAAEGEYVFVLANHNRAPSLKIFSLASNELVGDCALDETQRATDLTVIGDRAYVAREAGFGPEFLVYALDPANPGNCNYLRAHVERSEQILHDVRSLAVLPARSVAYLLTGVGQDAIQIIDLAEKDTRARSLPAFDGLCDEVTTVGSYLFAACRGADSRLSIFEGKQDDAQYLTWATVTSPPFDGGVAEPEWERIIWHAQGEGSVVLRTRTADTRENLAQALWVGPDGTRASAYTAATGETIGTDAGGTGSRWIQWKAYLGGSGSSTPLLENILVTFQ